ncbi:MAG: putative endonuclease [Gaiellaceae bacterium]|jgi:putative endonuclease|nr:putative endonuclease [Gaiellaceae bacterium]
MATRGGERAERRAVWWYRVHGYRIVARNTWVAGYELDIIVRRGRRLIFCEVKEKLGPRFGDPIEMVDDEKQRRIRWAAEAWLVRHPETARLEVSFDVIAVRSGRLERVPEAF